jgi:hypothetical protein
LLTGENHSAVRYKAGDIIMQKLAVGVAIGRVILGDVIVCTTDENPAVEHSGFVQLEEIAQAV